MSSLSGTTAAPYVFHMGRFSTRAPLDGGSVPKSYAEFDRAAADLAARGGGVMSIYYHPTELSPRETGTA